METFSIIRLIRFFWLVSLRKLKISICYVYFFFWCPCSELIMVWYMETFSIIRLIRFFGWFHCEN